MKFSPSWPVYVALAAVIVCLVPGGAEADLSVTQFENATGTAGVSYVGRSWGSMWGDYNGDGAPDFLLVNHQEQASLYLNQGNGTFQNMVSTAITPTAPWSYDAHGAAWADFDNDGDLDLYQLADDSNGPIPNLFYVNQSGLLSEQGVAHALDAPLRRGRMPLWVDYDRDGLLDVFHPVTRRGDGSDMPTALFRQSPGSTFSDVAHSVGIDTSETQGSNFALLSDLSGNGVCELITHTTGAFPDKVFDISAQPFSDIRDTLLIPVTANPVVDAVSADLDGDLDNDLFVVRGEKDQDFVQLDSRTVETHLQGTQSETGIDLQTPGSVLIYVYPEFSWAETDIFVGSSGIHPVDLSFSLSTADTNNHGIAPHTPGVDSGLYIGFNQGAGTWEIRRSVKFTNLRILSTSSITAVTAVGWDPATPPRDDVFLMNLGSSFTDQTQAFGFTTPSSGRNVVAGDFDNDMDLDLYIVSTGPVENLPNTLYENLGGGSFSMIPGGGGAAGTSLGRADAVTTADYDSDGFLDLLVTNGVSKAPFELDGPTELFHNLGNGNHWLEIDLEGLLSNRDGIGTRLIGTAGGVTQLREQTGGIHYRGQNHMRIHFGLGTNTQMDTLQVVWPSGIVQELHNIPADQVITVTEAVNTGVVDRDAIPARATLNRSYPNPFNPSTTISFSLPKPQGVSITIHDAAGREVRRLIGDSEYPAGIHEARWDGRNDGGVAVTSGVYFIKLIAEESDQVSKILLLK